MTEGKGVTETLISVVDDDESVRDSTKILLRSAGYSVATFESGALFLESDTLSETGCVVLDLRMPGMDGLELQRRLTVSDLGMRIIFVTAHDDKRSKQLAIDGGASDFFQKPFAASAFLAAIQTALKRCA
jgi:two-component system, LuxR family, response regulator FixJ